MSQDPREILARSPMGAMQMIAVVTCVLVTALDGFDVLSISFASPAIAEEWGINRAELGIVLSMDLIGMALGSVLLGGVADRIGRRPTVLSCLTVMAAGMFLASRAGSVNALLVYRLFTGLGIGGMLASINAMSAEYSNARRRNLAVSLMATGYPLGVVAGGFVASMLLKSFDWRSVFVFGGLVSISFLPLVWITLPESIEYLAHKRPPGALDRINKTLRRMGHETVAALPDAPDAPHVRIAQLFTPQLARTTILLTFAYFAHILTFYFILKWIPKIVVDMNFEQGQAVGVLVWANVGGAAGAIFLSLLTLRAGVRRLVIGALVIGAVMVALFGQGQSNLSQLALVAGTAGFFTNAAIVGLYAMFAQCFPTEVRAGGTGFVIGVGRGGAALGPIIAGFLFQSGYGLPIVAIMMATGSLFAAAALTMVHYREN